MNLNNFVHWLLSEDHCGNEAPPGSTTKLYVEEHLGNRLAVRKFVSYEEMTDDRRKHLIHVFAALDDGGSIGIGRPDEWNIIMDTKVALHLAWFVLWTWWAKGTWFGLKRAIWYSTLRRIIRGYKLEGRHHGSA